MHGYATKMNKRASLFHILLWSLSYEFVAAAWFCLIWNILGVHTAVGLGTVNYFTALGVLIIAVMGVAAAVTNGTAAFYTARHYTVFAQDDLPY